MFSSSRTNPPAIYHQFYCKYASHAKIQKMAFLKPSTKAPPITDHIPTDHRPPTNQPLTKCTEHRATDQRPVRNMRTRNSIPNFKWVSDKNMWGRAINTISRMWVIIFWLTPECVIEKIKLIQYHTDNISNTETYHTETARPYRISYFLHSAQCIMGLFCYLTTLPLFSTCHLTTLTHLFHLPSSVLSHLSQLTTHPTTNRSLQNSNVSPLGRQGKHVWLIVRQLFMEVGWWDVPLALWDLAEAISMIFPHPSKNKKYIYIYSNNNG